jgi:hypothetical protein
MEFTRELINHVVNEVKVPFDRVESEYHTWRAAQDEMHGIDAYVYDHYMTNVELPRAEASRMYELYCAEKLRLFETWKHAPQGQKANALREYIRYSVPPELHTHRENRDTYTKNVILYR